MFLIRLKWEGFTIINTLPGQGPEMPGTAECSSQKKKKKPTTKQKTLQFFPS